MISANQVIEMPYHTYSASFVFGFRQLASRRQSVSGVARDAFWCMCDLFGNVEQLQIRSLGTELLHVALLHDVYLVVRRTSMIFL